MRKIKEIKESKKAKNIFAVEYSNIEDGENNIPVEICDMPEVNEALSKTENE